MIRKVSNALVISLSRAPSPRPWPLTILAESLCQSSRSGRNWCSRSADRPIITRWPITGSQEPECAGSHEPNHRLFSATHTPPKFLCSILILAKSLRVYRARLTGRHGYDPVRKRIYITGDGEASVSNSTTRTLCAHHGSAYGSSRTPFLCRN